MATKGNPYQDDDGLKKLLLDEEGPIWRQIIPAPSTKGNTPAQSQWSLGRACPKCANSLIFFEYHEDKDIVYVQCSTCSQIFSEPDLEAHHMHVPEGTVDNINFRMIELSTIHLWMKAREDEKIRKGEWTESDE